MLNYYHSFCCLLSFVLHMFFAAGAFPAAIFFDFFMQSAKKTAEMHQFGVSPAVCFFGLFQNEKIVPCEKLLF